MPSGFWIGNLPYLIATLLLLLYFHFFFMVVFIFLYNLFFCFLLSAAYLTVANLARLGILVLSLASVKSQSIGQVHLLVLDYRWSHNPPTYWRTVTPNRCWTHTVPKFCLQSSCIGGTCHYIRLDFFTYFYFIPFSYFFWVYSLSFLSFLINLVVY